jgi:phage shock protein PspC (stress-responsive transcriptional regulator)
MIDETTPAPLIPVDHIAYAALHRETQDLIKKLQTAIADHVKDENNAFHDVTEIQTRLDDGGARMTRIEESIEDQRVRGDRIEHNIKGIRTSLAENTDMTAELVTIFTAAKGFFTFAGWISTGLKWIAGVVAGGAALYLTLKGLSK